MKSADIQAFMRVYETGSITQAASELFITQSSLSIRLSNLEEALGVTLFQRGKGRRDVTPTYQGEAFYRLALRYVEIEDEMYGMKEGKFQEKLKITMANSIATYLMTSVYERFMAEHPEIFLEIRDLGSQVSAFHLEIGDVDLAFTSDRVMAPEMHTVGVLEDPMVFVCHPDSNYPKVITRDQLHAKDEIYIDWTTEFDWWHQNQFGWTPRISLSIMSHLEYFLSQPNRWSIVPSSVAYHLVREGKAIEKQMGFTAPDRETICLYPKDTRKKKLIESFLDCMLETMAEKEDQRVSFNISE